MRKPLLFATLLAAVTLLQAPTVLAATVRWVNASGAGAPPGTSCAAAGYTTIQAAVAASSPNDTINVCPGTYVETLLLDKMNLNVVSTGGAAVTTVTPPASAHVVDITAAGVILKGFKILPVGFADADIGVNVAIDGNARVSILENVVTGGRIGVNLGCASDNSTVANNIVNAQTEGGINIDTCEAAPFPGSDSNDVHHNTACSDTLTGSIALGGSVTKNNVHHNVATKISIFGNGNDIGHNTTQQPLVDNGVNNLHDNVVDPTLCTPSTHQPPAGTLVFECFDMNEGDDPNASVRLTTSNFGTDAVMVRRAYRMCEPALKSRIDGGEVDVFPGANMSLTLVDPDGGEHVLTLDGAMAWHVDIGPEGQVIGDPGLAPEKAPLALVGLMLGGPDTKSFRGSFFDVFADFRLPPNPIGPNAITEQVNTTRGILDLPPFTHGGMADAFFDVFFDLTLKADPSPAPGDEMTLTLHPETAFSVGGPIDHKPPTGGATFNPTADVRIPLLDDQGAASGWFVTKPSINVAPTTQATRVLECYKTDKGQDPDDPFLLATRNFGRDEVLVRNATTMCEGAVKTKATFTDVAPPPVVWQCFNLANGDVPNAQFRITTNNFGNDKISVRKAVMLCEEAVKTRVTAAGQVTQIGHATGRVFECYSMVGKAVQQSFVLHTRNFGPDAVRITRPGLMCEPAKKAAIPNFPPFEDTPPSLEPPTGG